MTEEKTQMIINQIVNQVLNYKISWSIEKIKEKFAFDIFLPQLLTWNKEISKKGGYKKNKN